MYVRRYVIMQVCVYVYMYRESEKKMTVTLNQNRNLNQSCILARGVLKERRRRRRRKGGGACSEMPGGHVWGWAYFFLVGGGTCFFLWFTYDAASKRIKALPNREQ